MLILSKQKSKVMETTQPKRPSNHLVMAIITTILCCAPGLPAGIASIVFSTQVNKKYNEGDYEGAERASKNAKIAWIIALVLGLIGAISYIVFVFVIASDEGFREALEQELQRQQSLQNN